MTSRQLAPTTVHSSLQVGTGLASTAFGSLTGLRPTRFAQWKKGGIAGQRISAALERRYAAPLLTGSMMHVGDSSAYLPQILF